MSTFIQVNDELVLKNVCIDGLELVTHEVFSSSGKGTKTTLIVIMDNGTHKTVAEFDTKQEAQEALDRLLLRIMAADVPEEEPTTKPDPGWYHKTIGSGSSPPVPTISNGGYTQASSTSYIIPSNDAVYSTFDLTFNTSDFVKAMDDLYKDVNNTKKNIEGYTDVYSAKRKTFLGDVS